MDNQPEFKIIVIGNVAVVIDSDNGAQSVTNGIESVIRSVNLAVGLRGMALIYRDSNKIYSLVRISSHGYFLGFVSLGQNCVDLFDAIEHLKESSLIQIGYKSNKIF